MKVHSCLLEVRTGLLVPAAVSLFLFLVPGQAEPETGQAVDSDSEVVTPTSGGWCGSLVSPHARLPLCGQKAFS